MIGGLVVLSLSTVVAGTEKAPAIHAQLQSHGHALDVWRDTSSGKLTFQWADGDPGNVNRYDPSRPGAWSRIHLVYGVSRRQVRAALRAGSPSDSPPERR